MARLFYAGAPCFLTGCGWLNNKRLAELNPDDVCVNGQCRGHIENECPFYHHCGEITVEDHLLGFFSTEEDPPRRKQCKDDSDDHRWQNFVEWLTGGERP